MAIPLPLRSPSRRFYSGISTFTALWILILQSNALQLFNVRPRIFFEGESIAVKVRSAGFCNLPFCQPPKGIRANDSQIEATLETSPYSFRMNMNESEVVVCETGPLSAEDVALLSHCVDHKYRVHFFQDKFRATVPYNHTDERLRWWSQHRIGLPIGIRAEEGLYIFNHIKFRVTFLKLDDERIDKKPGLWVLGFEVSPCSSRNVPDSVKNLTVGEYYPSKIHCETNMVLKLVKENDPIVFTYEVEFIEIGLGWPYAWIGPHVI